MEEIHVAGIGNNVINIADTKTKNPIIFKNNIFSCSSTKKYNKHAVSQLFIKLHHNYDILQLILSFLYSRNIYNEGIWLCIICSEPSIKQLTDPTLMIEYVWHIQKINNYCDIKYDKNYFGALVCHQCFPNIINNNQLLHINYNDMKMKFICSTIRIILYNKLDKKLSTLFLIKNIIYMPLCCCGVLFILNLFTYFLSKISSTNIKSNMTYIYMWGTCTAIFMLCILFLSNKIKKINIIDFML